MTDSTDLVPFDSLTVATLKSELLAIVGDSPDAGLAIFAVHGRAKALAAKCRELVQLIESAAIEHIEDTKQDIPLPDGTRWYVSQAKTVKSRDDIATLHAILHAVGGDIDRITTGDQGVLAANPWKQGAVKQLVGAEAFERLFVTKYESDLKTGAAVKKLSQTNPAIEAARAIVAKGAANVAD